MEERRGRPLPPVLDPGAVGDEPEGDDHEQVPEPPGRLPVAADGRGQERFGQQHEGGEDGDEHHRRSGPVGEVVAQGRPQVPDAPDGRHDQQRPPGLLGRQRGVEGRHPEERHRRPGRQHHGDRRQEQALAGHDLGRPLGGEVDGGGSGEAGGDEQADGGGEDEAPVGGVEDDAGRGQCVHQQEAGAGEEGEGHEEQAGVASAPGRFADLDAEDEADRGAGRHQPQVAAVVLPPQVELGAGQEEPQAQQRQGEVHRPHRHPGRRTPGGGPRCGRCRQGHGRLYESTRRMAL